MRDFHVLGIGSFGESVAKKITNNIENSTSSLISNNLLIPANWDHAKIQIIASWRIDVKKYQFMEKLFNGWGVPWLSITMDNSILRIGPIVVPNKEGCFSCFYKRKLQHSLYSEYITSLDKFYNDNPDEGPRGYLDVHAGLGASAFSMLRNDLLGNIDKLSGQVLEIDIIKGSTRKLNVTGIHGCQYCGLQRNEKERSYIDILNQHDEIFGMREKVHHETY